MLNNKLVMGVLAVTGVSAVNLEGIDTKDPELNLTLKQLNRKVGNVKYTRPHEKEVFHLDNILGDFYGQTGKAFNRKIDYSVPKLRYPDPKPYSYSVTEPTLLYREVEHIAPPKYESPVLRDLAEIETYPEGWTNEYSDYTEGAYTYGDGSDHSHFRYDNAEDIHFHQHGNPFKNERHKPILPAADHFFVTQVNFPTPQADYTGIPPIYQRNPGTYTHPELGVQVYLVDDKIVPGQTYTPEAERPKAIRTLRNTVEDGDYDGPQFALNNFDVDRKLQGYKRPKTIPKYEEKVPEPYVSPFPNLVGPWPGETYPEPVYEEVVYVEEPTVEPYVEVYEEPYVEVVEEPEPVYVPEPEPTHVPEPEPVYDEETNRDATPRYTAEDFKIPTTYKKPSDGYLGDYGKPKSAPADFTKFDYGHHDDEDDENSSDSESEDEDYLGDYSISGFRKFGRRPTYNRSRRSSRGSASKGYTRNYGTYSKPTTPKSSYKPRASKPVPEVLQAYDTNWLDALF